MGDKLNSYKGSSLKAYMAYSRGAGPQEGAVLVVAHNIREARKMAWPCVSSWNVHEYTDMAVRLMHSYVLALADQDELAVGRPHVVDNPAACQTCEFWGYDVEDDGRTCEWCSSDAGDVVAEKYRVYRKKETQ